MDDHRATGGITLRPCVYRRTEKRGELMSTRDEIWVIGRDPPGPRCDYLGQTAHELVNDLNLPIMIRHLA